MKGGIKSLSFKLFEFDLYGVLNANLTNRKLKLNKRINTAQS